MMMLENNRVRGLCLCAIIFGLLMCTGKVLGDVDKRALPTPEKVPGGERPPIERERPASERAVADVASRSQVMDQSLEAGVVVRLSDIAPETLPARKAAPKIHQQGDAQEGLALPPQQPGTLPASARAYPPYLEGAAQSKGGSGLIPVRQQFDGIAISDSFNRPPDTHLAVGPQYAVEVVNSGFSVYSKMGDTARGYHSFDNFLEDSIPGIFDGRFFDPRVVYDPTYEKFVMLVLGKDDDREVSGYWIAVSETSDPRGDWCIRARDATITGAFAPTWIDFAGLATDAFGVYVTGNYLFFGSDTLRGGAIHSFPDEMMTSCAPVGGSVMYDMRWSSDGTQARSLQPAQAHTQNVDGETFFVNTDPFFGDTVMLTRLSGNRANNPSITSAEIAIPAYGAFYNNVDQPGSEDDLDAGKSNVLSAVYVDGRVLFALTTAVIQTSESSGWLTVELDTATNTRVWDDITWLGEGRYLMYPALTYEGTTRDGVVAIFGSMTDAESQITPFTEYASGYVRLYDNRANDNGGAAQVFAHGTSHYVFYDNDDRNRWGDYSGAAYDWRCGHAWGAVESASGPISWKTTISAFEFNGEGDCPQLFVTAPVLNQPLNSGGVTFITWEAEDLPPGEDIFVFLDTADALPVQIGDALPITQRTLSWVIPEVPGDDARVIVGSFDDNAGEYSALHYSDPFTIVDVTPPGPLVWQNPPAATSSQAIAMQVDEVTDGSGSLVQYLFELTDSPGGGQGGAGRDWAFLPVYQNTGLDVNAEYCYRAAARDQALNQTQFTQQICAFTLANAPTLGSFTNVTNTAITIEANTNGNPQNTEYLFENLTSGTSSSWLDLPQWEDTGLLPNRSYLYRVKARNGDGIETVWTVLGAAATTNDDADGDGVLAADDNCLNVANADQRDTDGDSFGNVCDFDLSQDCIVNVIDLGFLRQRFFTADPDADFDGDGAVNFVDLGLMRTGFFSAPGPSGRPNGCLVTN